MPQAIGVRTIAKSARVRQAGTRQATRAKASPIAKKTRKPILLGKQERERCPGESCAGEDVRKRTESRVPGYISRRFVKKQQMRWTRAAATSCKSIHASSTTNFARLFSAGAQPHSSSPSP
jgi:hypothetical protein